MRTLITQKLYFFLVLFLGACDAATVEVGPAELGTPATPAQLGAALEQQGFIQFEKHKAADWAVPLSGLLNLDHPKSQAAGLVDKEEEIEIFVYSIRHPQYGTFLVDSGVAESFTDQSVENEASWIVETAMNMSALEVVKTTKQLVQEIGGIDGVFLTHIHMDHIMGLPDVSSTPVYGGPDDAPLSTFMNVFTQGTTDRMLRNVNVLQEWQFDEAGLVDVFGDGSFWAIHSPGHTPGATAYLAMTTTGPQLMVGDATHTAWGWNNGVEPGSYSHDIELSKLSLKKLKDLANNNPQITVHPGHQPL